MARRLLELLDPSMTEQAQRFHEQLRRRVLSRLIETRWRLAPLIVVLAGFFAWLSPTPLRLALFGGAATFMFVFASVEARANARTGLSDTRLTLTVMLTGALQLVVMFATGGVAGPLLPATLLIALVTSLLLRRREAMLFVLGLQIPAVWAFAIVQQQGLLPELHVSIYDGNYAAPGSPGIGPYVAAVFFSLMLLGALMMGRHLGGILDELLKDIVEEREASLALHAESARTMAALSGEIAHELKNPLASIKGLAALVGRDLSGVPAERMDVLRREVDRMQGILDEFLTYSRPLVPLAIERTDLVELLADVAAMHEGMAAERNVALEVARTSPMWVRCDPRKVRQIVINLVQNAIDASPDGGTVRLEAAPEAGAARVWVTDRGAGIAVELKDRLFNVGATSKPKGTGLGLVVARGLARQHGGELELTDQVGGGARATLSLPATPTETPAETAGAHAERAAS